MYKAALAQLVWDVYNCEDTSGFKVWVLGADGRINFLFHMYFIIFKKKKKHVTDIKPNSTHTCHEAGLASKSIACNGSDWVQEQV